MATVQCFAAAFSTQQHEQKKKMKMEMEMPK